MAPPKAYIVLPKAPVLSLKARAAAEQASVDTATKNQPAANKHDKHNRKAGKSSKPAAAQKAWWQQDTLRNDSDKPFVASDTPWFSQYKDILTKEAPSPSGAHSLDVAQSALLESKVSEMYKSELKVYSTKAKGTAAGDEKWLNSVITAGTWSDKMAALALKVQESPFHNLEALDLLLGIAIKKDSRTSGMAVEALKDLFVSNLLPDRPLVLFQHMPIKHPEFKPKYALLAWYEKELKARYGQLLDVVDKALKANLVYFRKQALSWTQDLLNSKPEQEGRLLAMLVNKLGDSEGVVTSKASELLKGLVAKHPAMSAVVVYEVRMFIQRSADKIPPLFVAVTFLNVVQVRDGDERTAHLLAESFLSLFEVALQAKEKGSRLLAALLKGINRIFPKVTQLGTLGKHIDTIFRLAHTAQSQTASTQALVLISHIAFQESSSSVQGADEGRAQISNRFYQALYTRLLADQIIKQSHNTVFLNLLFRSIKLDPLPARAMAFIKRIMMAATQAPSPLSAGLMLIVSEVLAQRPELSSMMTNAEVCLDDVQSRLAEKAEDDGSVASVTDYGLFGGFDADKRDPRFACSDQAVPVLFELSLLRHHFHPSVKSFAAALLEPPAFGIEYAGDPLEEFNIPAFLDRFAYKHPKQQVADRLQQRRGARRTDEQPINSEFSESDQTQSKDMIAPEKHFFHKYFGERSALLAAGKMRKRNKARAEGEGDSDDDELDEDEVDAFADQLAEGLVKSSAHNDGDDGEDWPEEDDGEGDDSDAGAEDWDEAADAVDLEDFRASTKMNKRPRDDDGDDSMDEDMPEVYRDSDEEGMEEDGWEEEEEVPAKGKKGKKADQAPKKKARSNEFADADDFEEEMEANVKAHSLEMMMADDEKLKKKDKKKKGGNKIAGKK